MKYYDSSRRPITLSKELGSGGEGSVWTISEKPYMVAKLYKPNYLLRSPQQSKKLQTMIRSSITSEPNLGVAWPQELVYSATNQVVGYVMPEVRKSLQIHEYAREKSRPIPLASWQLFKLGRNLALTVAAIHRHGLVIGDFNECNVMVNDQLDVTLVDTDSFQIRSANAFFPCPVRKDEFLAPELHDQTVAGQPNPALTRTQESDLFALSVLLFLLLQNNRHPFAGVPFPVQRTIPLVHIYGIQKRQFPYFRRHWSDVRPRADHLAAFNSLPLEVRHAFQTSFSEGLHSPLNRLPAGSWAALLAAAEQQATPPAQKQAHPPPHNQPQPTPNGPPTYHAISRLSSLSLIGLYDISLRILRLTARYSLALFRSTIQGLSRKGYTRDYFTSHRYIFIRSISAYLFRAFDVSHSLILRHRSDFTQVLLECRVALFRSVQHFGTLCVYMFSTIRKMLLFTRWRLFPKLSVAIEWALVLVLLYVSLSPFLFLIQSFLEWVRNY